MADFLLESIVTRTFGMDFIYFDLIFLTLWIGFLVYKRYWKPIIWGIIGWLVYILTDYYIWYIVMESRTYTGPLNPNLFFMWFCFSPGFTQFSYVALMLEKRKWRDLWLWTLMFYIGWTFVSVGSQLIPWDDRIIEVARNMNEARQRLTFGLMTLSNLIIAFILYAFKKLRLQDILYLFIVGTLVEFCLEFTLTVSGIRLEQETWSFQLMVINTLIEFNMGIVLMYIVLSVAFNIWTKPIFKEMLGWRDFKHIKTDYNLVREIIDKNKNLDEIYQNGKIRYSREKIETDLEYLRNRDLT